MTLEEKIRAYAAKGELVHLSIAFSASGYVALFAAASPAGGYSTGRSADPVEAIEKAFKASPAKPARVSKPKQDRDIEIMEQLSGGEEGGRLEKTGALRSDWTTP